MHATKQVLYPKSPNLRKTTYVTYSEIGLILVFPPPVKLKQRNGVMEDDGHVLT